MTKLTKDERAKCAERKELARIKTNFDHGLAVNPEETGLLLAAHQEALAALKDTDSWLWNKVVNGTYGPVGDEVVVCEGEDQGNVT